MKQSTFPAQKFQKEFVIDGIQYGLKLVTTAICKNIDGKSEQESCSA